MDTPPYSDVSAQLSPGAHALHVNGDPHAPGPSNAVAHPHTPNGSSAGPSNVVSSATGSVDIRSLYSTSWSAIESPPPPTLREILTAYKQKGDGDRDMLLAMLNAKSAEDQRIASQLSLRRTMLEINRQTTEALPQPHQHPPYSHSSHAHGHGQHVYTYVPDEQYHHQQHHIAPPSPPPPHVYTNSYSSNARMHGHLRAVESPPLSSVTQKTMASLASRTRAVPRPHSRDATRPGGDARSQTYTGTTFESQPHIPGQSQGQNQRRKRARHSRSRSRSPIPVASSSSHRAYNYTYTRSPPSHSASHSHSHTEAEPEPDRSPYSSASASDIGSPRAHQTRTMAIGSLLTAGSKARAAADHGSDVEPNERPNGDSSMTTERVKEERLDRGLKPLRQTGRDHHESIERMRVYDRERNTTRG